MQALLLHFPGAPATVQGNVLGYRTLGLIHCGFSNLPEERKSNKFQFEAFFLDLYPIRGCGSHLLSLKQARHFTVAYQVAQNLTEIKNIWASQQHVVFKCSTK